MFSGVSVVAGPDGLALVQVNNKDKSTLFFVKRSSLCYKNICAPLTISIDDCDAVFAGHSRDARKRRA